ncbi:MAG: EamA family transporter [Polyangia bacterium]
MSTTAPARAHIVVAYLIVYLVWGSTYLAIREAIATLPPLGMAAARFLAAGSILYVIATLRGAPQPTAKQWRMALVVGALLLLGGNGCVVLAERRLSSGITALLAATEPLSVALLAWSFPGGSRPSLRTVLGIVFGIGGVVVLVSSHSGFGGEQLDLVGTSLVMVSGFCWALGSLIGSGIPARDRLPSMMSCGVQMLLGGALLLVVSVAIGEPATFHVATVSSRSWFSFWYLVVAGSLVGFSAYSWLIEHEPPQRVATYAFVNPAVAVLIGWALVNEPVGPGTLVAGGMIIVAVMLIVLQRPAKA